MPPKRSNYASTADHKGQDNVPAPGREADETKFKLTIDLTPDLRRQLGDYQVRKAAELKKSRVPLGKMVIAMMTAAFTDQHTDDIVTDLLR